MHWDVSPVMLQLGGLTIFWYGFLFTLGLLATVFFGHRVFVLRGLEERHASNLTFWTIAGLFLGAHVFDVVFYNWSAFIENPAILLNLRHGLSSHGGAVGVVVAVLAYARLYRLDFHRFADGVLLAAVWLVPSIRLGNFFNSEVVGLPTDMPWGVVFVQLGETQARHPVQLYEATMGVGLLVLSSWLHRRHRHRLRKGATIYIVLGSYFAIRTVLELFKERQAISPDFPLTMGQLMSLPGAMICGFMLWWRRPVVVPLGDPDAGDPRPLGATAPIGAPEPDADASD